jgi:protein phosphatase
MEQVRQGLLTREEAQHSQLSNVILRALGAGPTVDVEMDELWLGADDRILLCSDGLTRMLSDEKVAKVMAAERDSQRAADRLVELANEAGGEDNITVIVAHLLSSRSTGWWGRLFGGGSREWPN